jgi:DNA-binding LacI/PurR family transcriptional regulator
MEELAACSGYSLSTVSRALDPVKCKLLKPETTERIRKLAHKYNYVSNPAARRLSRRKTETLTLIMNPRILQVTPTSAPDFDAHFGCTIWEIIRGIISEAKQNRYDLKIEPMLDANSIESIKPYLDQSHTDGIIFIPTLATEFIIKYVLEEKLPAVILNKQNTELQRQCSGITLDIKPGIADGLDYLIGRGHRKIGCLFFKGVTASEDKLVAFQEHLASKGLFDKDLIFQVQNDFELRKMVEDFNGKPPFSAIFCANDSGADRMVRELRYNGIKVPEDIAVFGYDNNLIYTGETGINISTVDWGRKDIGQKAVKMLISLIEKGNSCNQPVNTIIKSEFISKQTT